MMQPSNWLLDVESDSPVGRERRAHLLMENDDSSHAKFPDGQNLAHRSVKQLENVDRKGAQAMTSTSGVTDTFPLKDTARPKHCIQYGCSPHIKICTSASSIGF